MWAMSGFKLQPEQLQPDLAVFLKKVYMWYTL